MTLVVTAVTGIPEVRAGDDLASLIADALRAGGLDLEDGDVLVVSSKVASKSLGLTAPTAERSAVIDAESDAVVAERLVDGRLTQVVRAKAGPVMAAAGVDASNTGGLDHLLLLPRDPDDVCRRLHERLAAAFDVTRLAVVLSDTAGRPWRSGQTDFALGAHGLVVSDDLRGGTDADGRPLHVTSRAVADELAAAAELVKGKASALPVAHVRGAGDSVVAARPGMPGARDLVRTGPGDWFALGHVEAVRAALGVLPGSRLAGQVGIAATEEEPRSVKVARAVATAIHDLAEVGADAGNDEVVVTGEAVDRGLAAARIAVALWAEGLEGRITERSTDALVISVTSAAEPVSAAGASGEPSAAPAVGGRSR